MKSVIQSISDNDHLELQLVLGDNLEMSRYGDYGEHINKDGFKIDEKLDKIINF